MEYATTLTLGSQIEAKKMCSKVKHTFTNEGKCKRLNPMIPKCISILGFEPSKSPKYSKPWLKRKINTIWAPMIPLERSQSVDA
jgi:hypothetical protein